MSIWSQFANKAYLSADTLTSISQSFTYKMAAKINWHRYGTKLRHCHPMYCPCERVRVCCQLHSKDFYKMLPFKRAVNWALRGSLVRTPVVHRWPAKRPCVQPAAAAGSRCHGNRISDAVTCNTDTPVAADRHADAQRTIPRRPAGRAGLSPTCGLARRSATLVAEAGAVVDLSPSTSSRSSEHQHRYRSPHHDRIDISLRMNEFRHFLLSPFVSAKTCSFRLCNEMQQYACTHVRD